MYIYQIFKVTLRYIRKDALISYILQTFVKQTESVNFVYWIDLEMLLKRINFRSFERERL